MPPAPTVTPLMDGVATIGSSGQYADAAHIHPSDTSKLALAGGTLTGPLTLAADPGANLQAATKQYVDASTSAVLATGAAYGGFVNRLRNGTFDVWQRGTSVVAPSTGAYTADGWQISWLGAAPSISRGGQLKLSNSSGIVNGIAGNTSSTFTQRIESNIAASLGPKTNAQSVTFQATVFNNMTAAIVPQISVLVPTAVDNFAATTTLLAATNMQSCPGNGAVTTIAYTFSVPANGVVNGLSLNVAFGAITANFVAMTDCDLRATPGIPVGLNNNPPPPELRPTAMELAFCQRYYEAHIGDLMSMNLTGCTNQPFYKHTTFKATKRAVPTMTFVNGGASGFAAVAPTLNTVNADGVTWTINAASALINAYVTCNWTASAEL